jgi:hypothetical protein
VKRVVKDKNEQEGFVIGGIVFIFYVRDVAFVGNNATVSSHQRVVVPIQVRATPSIPITWEGNNTPMDQLG